MRLKNLTELADLLRDLDNDKPIDGIGFDMTTDRWDMENSNHPCGSACCIGGWVQLCNPDTRTMRLASAVQTIAPNVSYEELDYLCYPMDDSLAWSATPQQAARAVEILRDTGKCDWDRAMQEVTA